MTDYLQVNRDLWKGWTGIHERSAFYDVDGFRAGKTSLNFIELGELGDVAGKSLLHLQCHFGMDTLSWARLGADVTGVDFSPEALALARRLSAETGTPATFIESDILELPAQLDRRFDIVFTSYGAIEWISDMTRWAENIAHFLAPGGVFYMVEFHPIMYLFDTSDLRVEPGASYFPTREPVHSEVKGSYADANADFAHEAYSWNHPLSQVIMALLDAGLHLEFLHEYPFSVYKVDPEMVAGPDGWWRWRSPEDSIPIMYSLRASK